MARDFFPEDMFDWEDDDDDDVSIAFGTDSEPEFLSYDDEDWNYQRQRQISRFVEYAYKADGLQAITEILHAVESCTLWRLEIIADSHGLDDFIFARYNTFDDNAWLFFINSPEYEQMTYDITLLSNIAAESFARVHFDKKLTYKQVFRNFLMRVVRRLS
jgi:hypothetical protein